MRFHPAFTLVLVLAATSPMPVWAEALPTIVTYELKKQREAERVIARNPKAFWVRQIVTRIEDRKKDLPKPLGKDAVVQLAFTVARDGHIVSKTVAQSSGNPELDRAATAMLDRAQPFPAMPDSLTDTELSFTLPVRFH